MKRQLPKFSSEKEFIDWIDTHDTSEYMDSWEEVTEEIGSSARPVISNRLDWT